MRFPHLSCLAAGAVIMELGVLFRGPVGILAAVVAMVLPGWLVSRRLALVTGLALIAAAGLGSWALTGEFRAWLVTLLLVAAAAGPAWRRDRAGAALPRIDRRHLAAAGAVAAVTATAFALTTVGSVLPDDDFFQARLTAPQPGKIAVEVVNHSAAAKPVVVATSWGSATEIRVEAGATTVLRLPFPCTGRIDVTVTAPGVSRRLTREVLPGDC
ncbi:hypothetical protein [Symbioplanes lichenis]|uniref:hypothetical protein n=1 Tax=Symbioplanes lichenis TaxID=1629072 RepID=UPI0027399A30|nr:hypothetical protein [Actinoplanes lichenis]